MNLLIQILVALAVSLLKHIQGREDLKQTAFDKVSREDAADAMAALEWKSRAAAAPDGGATLRVREPDNRVEIHDSDADSQREP